MKRKNNDFDQIIREKLERMDTPYQPGDWDLFEQRLDAEEAGMPEVEEAVIDTLVFDKLHQIEAPYDPAHWQIMAGKLNELYGLRRKIATYKLMELALMLLLLITLAQILPEPSSVPATPEKAAPSDDAAAGPQAMEDVLDASSGEAPATALSDREESASASTTNSGQAGTPSSETSLIRTTRTDAAKDGKALGSVSPLKKKQSVPPGLTPITFLEVAPPLKLASEQTAARQSLLFRKAIEQNIQLEKHKEKIAELAAIATLSLEALPSPFEYGLGVEEAPLAKSYSIRIGMQGGGGYDRIITPPTIIEGQKRSERADRLALGYLGGLSIGVERGRWGVETGFLYEAKSYDPPKPVIYVDGGFKNWEVQGVRRYSIDILNIPLWIKYNFVYKDRWRVYALGGASGHFVMQSSYFLGDEESFQTANFRPNPAPAPGGGRNNTLDEKLAEENREFVKGILDGGKIGENTFFSVNVGAGVERYMSYRWSVFTQPVYQHSLLYLNGGLGPYQDRIHNLSILMGVKIKL